MTEEAGLTAGQTRSGKDVFGYILTSEVDGIHPLNIDYSLEDHFDAYSIFQYLAWKAKRISKELDWFEHYRDQSDFHEDYLKKIRVFRTIKREAGVNNAFELRDFGKLFSSEPFN